MTDANANPLSDPGEDLRKRNRRSMIAGVLLVFTMIGLAFASVPLYRLFCQVTGFDGTTQKANALPEKTLDRVVTVRFNTDVDSHLPWHFKPEIKDMKVKLGQGGLVAFRAENMSDHALTGNSVFNVTPTSAGIYFHKIQCFCFQEQTLGAKQAVDMPVYFFVDPAMNDDPNLEDVQTITLSYTFFPAKSKGLEKAQEEYYRQVEQQNSVVTN
jgi:cytochrome c oxidase assembly protein subunit 11